MSATATPTAPVASPLTEAQRAFAEAVGFGAARAARPAEDPPKATLGNVLAGHKPGSLFELTATGELKHRSPAATEDEKAPAAEMGALLTPLERPLAGVKLPGGLNAGHLIIGGAAGAIVAEVINGISPRGVKTAGMPVSSNTLIKLVAIGLLAVVGSKVMSKQAAAAAATVVGAQVLADVLPLDTLVDKITGLIRPGASSGNRYIAAGSTAKAGAFPGVQTQSRDALSQMWGR